MRDCPNPRAGGVRWPRSRPRRRHRSKAPKHEQVVRAGSPRRREKRGNVAKIKLPSPSEGFDRLRDTEVWKSIFRPGSIYRRGYKDTSRDRALATMNNVLYHLHPTKVKRHGLKLTY